MYLFYDTSKLKRRKKNFSLPTEDTLFHLKKGDRVLVIDCIVGEKLWCEIVEEKQGNWLAFVVVNPVASNLEKGQIVTICPCQVMEVQKL